MTEKVLVPDVGDAEEVTVVEVLVSVGDTVSTEDSIIVLESDKASMEIPSPGAGKVSAINVSEGDIVNEGDLILELETEDEGTDDQDETPSGDDEAPSGDDETPASDKDASAEDTEASDNDDTEEPDNEDKTTSEAPAESEGADAETGGQTASHTVTVPDVGGASEVIVVEVLVGPGDQVDAEDSIVVLESDKASMDIPAGVAGTIKEVLVSEGEEVTQDDSLVVMDVEAGKAGEAEQKAGDDSDEKDEKDEKPAEQGKSEPESAGRKSEPERSRAITEPASEAAGESEDAGLGVAGGKVHAGPAVRKQAREYGVDLADVKGTGRKGRILKEDVQKYVKDRLSKGGSTQGQGGIPPVPAVDFTKFGEVDVQALSRVRKSSARNLHRSWLNVPHVTQFDEADITDLETFRKSWNEEHKDEGVKVTPLAFLIKICVNALIQYPHFNASLDEAIENLIVKRYYNIGIAVDTDDGLVVPVIKDVDQKGVVQLARESADLAAMARDKKLPLDSMQGATFTISSLGGIGGTAFTPIVNAPEVAILGVSRARVAPVFDGEGFSPRTMLPLSLSYDHRAIDGAEAARFSTWLANALTDVPHVLM